MSYEHRLNELRRCGCSSCMLQYGEMIYNMDSARRDVEAFKYLTYPIQLKDKFPFVIQIEKETPKVEEIKNSAIKVLVDKLKVEQLTLASNSSLLKSAEATAKNYRDNKNKNLKSIKELADALKKLGYKEAKPNAS